MIFRIHYSNYRIFEVAKFDLTNLLSIANIFLVIFLGQCFCKFYKFYEFHLKVENVRNM